MKSKKSMSTEFRDSLRKLRVDNLLERFEREHPTMTDAELRVFNEVMVRRRCGRRISKCKKCEHVNGVGALRCASCRTPLLLVGYPGPKHSIGDLRRCGYCGSTAIEDVKRFWKGRVDYHCRHCGFLQVGYVHLEYFLLLIFGGMAVGTIGWLATGDPWTGAGPAAIIIGWTLAHALGARFLPPE